MIANRYMYLKKIIFCNVLSNTFWNGVDSVRMMFYIITYNGYQIHYMKVSWHSVRKTNEIRHMRRYTKRLLWKKIQFMHRYKYVTCKVFKCYTVFDTTSHGNDHFVSRFTTLHELFIFWVNQSSHVMIVFPR